jgi:hypothetical protein
LALGAALAIATLTANAHPQANRSADEATRRYLEGSRLVREGQPERGLAELRASMELLPSANTELLVGHALRQLGRKVEAIQAYEHVVEVAGARVRAGEERFRPTLADAGRWVALSRAELAEVRVAVEHAPAGATVTIDGSAVAGAPDAGGTLRARAWREPGPAVVEVTAPDGRSATRKADLEAGTTRDLAFDLAPAAPSSGPPLASWIAAGVGVTGLAVFVTFGIVAESAASELRECEDECRGEDKIDAADRGQRAATIANVALAVGAAGVVAAGVIWLVDSRSRSDTSTAPSASLGIAPGGLALRGRF